MMKKELLLAGCLLMLLSACSRTVTTNPTATGPGTTPVPSHETQASESINWEDYSVYEAGLIPSAQSAIGSTSGAKIYHISVVVAEDMLSLKGVEDIRYTNLEAVPLNEIYFQLFPNMEGGSSTIDTASVDGSPMVPQYEDGDADAKLTLPNPLQPGEKTTLHLEFTVTLPQDAGGNYGLFGFIDNILVLDGFYPAIPVYDGDGWHKGLLPPNSDTTFQDVSYYLVTITAPQDLVIVTSGVSVSSTEADGKQTVVYALGPARDFYIAASSDFRVVSRTVGETTVNSYAIQPYSEGAELALDTAAKAIETFNKYVGLYPYTEFDIVSTPMQGALGIEYPAIVGINYNLYDPTATMGDVSALSYLESTVAHETGHQWFYSVIGDDQINEPWLDEATTQYITGLYYLDNYGESGFNNYESSWYGRWDRVNREQIPIGLPAGDYDGKEYSAIVYGRGPIFIDALAETMGQENFDRFLKVYFETYKWGIATTEDFRSLAEQECQCDLFTLFSDWVYE